MRRGGTSGIVAAFRVRDVLAELAHAVLVLRACGGIEMRACSRPTVRCEIDVVITPRDASERRQVAGDEVQTWMRSG